MPGAWTCSPSSPMTRRRARRDGTLAGDQTPPGSTWEWPIDVDRYDRRATLTKPEQEALQYLGLDLRRQLGHNDSAAEWRTIGRLLRPLDDARATLRWCPDVREHRRAVDDAIGLVLLRCAEHGLAFWGWSAEQWARLIGTSIREFERPWPGGWLSTTSRPYVAAFAYLLGNFTEFHLLGKFSRLALSRRVFGEDAVDVAVGRVRRVLAGWGYHSGRNNDQRLFTVAGQALLLARSPAWKT
jgi:hypothetical protein